MFSCEFCKISKINFFYRTPPLASSDLARRLPSYATDDILLQYKIYLSVIAIILKILLTNSTLTFKNVSKDKVSAIIKNLDTKKASKYNVILTRILKKSSELLADFLYRNSHQRCSIKIGVLKNFAKSTGKHLRQGLFFNKVAALSLATLLKKGSGTGVSL